MALFAVAQLLSGDRLETVWFVYLLECLNGRLYTGITPDLAARFRRHVSGRGAMFTRINRPARMLAAIPCATRSEALRLEAAVKRLRPEAKRLLAAGWPLQTGLPELNPGFGPQPLPED